MTINILCPRTYAGHGFASPFRRFKTALRRVGLDVAIHHNAEQSTRDGDVLCIVNKYFSQRNKGRRCDLPECSDWLRVVRDRVNTLIWFDAGDSSGVTNFEVMPLVDLYAKSQLLRDRTLYTRPFYQNRYFCDYYRHSMAITDDEVAPGRVPLDPEYLDKMAVSWNLGLADAAIPQKWRRRLRMIWPSSSDRLRPVSPSGPRAIDVSFRVGYKETPTVDFQRHQIYDVLQEVFHRRGYSIVAEGRVSPAEYARELSQTRVLPSPFGWGEICFRDFECFLNGAALLKPDMSEFETWPNYFLPEKTYVPFAWDCADFEQKLRDLLDSPGRQQEIARQGQEVYLASRSVEAGGDKFAQQFLNIIQRAQSRSKAPVHGNGQNITDSATNACTNHA